MSYHFRNAAEVEDTHILVAFSGPSGCGKTKSALRLARGLVGEHGKFCVIDTEARRAARYKREHVFDHLELRPPFRPAVVADAVEAAEKAGYDAAIIDSVSHEYNGTGGILEWADEEEAAGKLSPRNWTEPKEAHRAMMNRLLQSSMHLIFTLRAEEKIKLEDDPKRPGKKLVVPIGFKPICEKGFLFEMTASFTMLPDAPGVPHPVKLEGHHRPFFPTGEVVTEETGRLIAEFEASAPTRAQAAALRVVLHTGEIVAVASMSEWVLLFRDDAKIALTTDTNVAAFWEANREGLNLVLAAAIARGKLDIADSLTDWATRLTAAAVGSASA